MPAQEVLVDANSVDQYGEVATQTFVDVRVALQKLVDDVATVKYEGENALQFKREAGQMAVQFANGIKNDMVSMTQSVNAATTSILQSLGGRDVSIRIDNTAVEPKPVTAGQDGVVSVVYSSLEALAEATKASFDAVAERLEFHKGALIGTTWQGNAKERAKTAVTSLTSNATGNCQTAQQKMTTFINDQISGTSAADGQ